MKAMGNTLSFNRQSKFSHKKHRTQVCAVILAIHLSMLPVFSYVSPHDFHIKSGNNVFCCLSSGRAHPITTRHPYLSTQDDLNLKCKNYGGPVVHNTTKSPQHYKITTTQRIGLILFCCVWFPLRCANFRCVVLLLF